MVFETNFKKIKKRVIAFLEEEKKLPYRERKKLLNQERYTNTIIKFYGKTLHIVDSTTFLASYYEIYKKEIYKFECFNSKPIIIDCGANIGLSTLYLKQRFPNANIIAFEPDPNIYQALQKNMISHGYLDIICKNEAITDEDKVLDFFSEGGHSGMIVKSSKDKPTISVKGIRLKSFLKNYKSVDFLKIDIEGEESKVLYDIAEELKKVDRLFLEYHSFLNQKQELGEILKIITAAGMRYYIEEGIHKPNPFVEREVFNNMDLLSNIFCYR
ncbi:MAG: FkbM family methyltransferase [Pedobacter sp.]|nr:MAG: FkbM family methyltransferase [Pedobacter sp.]